MLIDFIISFMILFSSFLFSFHLGSEVGWIQKHQEQLRRFITTSFLEGMLNHLRKADVLSSAEEIRIKEAGRIQDQVNMLTTIVTGKDTQGSDVLRGFIESSDSQVAQLVINHGKGLEIRFSLCVGDFQKGDEEIAFSSYSEGNW